MGCDIGIHEERPPYCKPKCKEFRLISSSIGDVRAQCVKCSLHHDFTIIDGIIKIDQGEQKR